MNRARQDSITTEIMEIVSGAEALGSSKTKQVRYVDIDAQDQTSTVTELVTSTGAGTTHDV